MQIAHMVYPRKVETGVAPRPRENLRAALRIMKTALISSSSARVKTASLRNRRAAPLDFDRLDDMSCLGEALLEVPACGRVRRDRRDAGHREAGADIRRESLGVCAISAGPSAPIERGLPCPLADQEQGQAGGAPRAKASPAPRKTIRGARASRDDAIR